MLLHGNGDTFNSVGNALNVTTGRMVLKCDAVFVFLVTSSCGNHCGNHEQRTKSSRSSGGTSKAATSGGC